MFSSKKKAGNVMRSMVQLVCSKLRKMSVAAQFKVMAVVTAAATGLVALTPASSLAVESETTKKVGEVAGKVGTEGVEIVLVILTALVALIVAIIIIPKAIGLIKRFI